MWHWKFQNPQFKTWSDWLKEEFRKTHPNVSYEFVQPAALFDQVRTAIAAGGDVPDVVGVSEMGFVKGVYEGGYWLDLKPYIDADQEWKKWVEGWSAVPQVQWMIDGKIIVNNISSGPMFIYYRKDLFEKAGVQPPKTFDELLALVPKFQAIGVDTMATGLDPTSAWQYAPWFWTMAGIIDYDWALQRQVNECGGPWAGDPVAKEALENFLKLYKEGVLRKQTPQEKYHPDASGAFARAEVAMYYHAGVWNNSFIPDLENVGVIYFPALKAGDKPVFMGSNDIAVSVLDVTEEQKDPDHREAVVEFVKLMASPASQSLLWDVGVMPLLPEAIGATDAEDQKLTAQQIMMSSSPDARTLFYDIQIATLNKAMSDGMLGLLIDATTIDQVLADLDAACAGQ